MLKEKTDDLQQLFFRIDRDLYSEMRILCFRKKMSVQKWVLELIEKEMEKQGLNKPK